MSMSKINKVAFVAVVIFLAAVIASIVWQKVNCYEIPANDGSFDCYGTETYKHCEPAKKLVCPAD